MKRIIIGLMILFCVVSVAAVGNNSMNFQSIIRNATNGIKLIGNHTVRVNFTNASNGAVLFSDNRTIFVADDGVLDYITLLRFNPLIFKQGTVRYQMQIDNDVLPFQSFSKIPYAAFADYSNNTEFLNGQSASYYTGNHTKNYSDINVHDVNMTSWTSHGTPEMRISTLEDFEIKNPDGTQTFLKLYNTNTDGVSNGRGDFYRNNVVAGSILASTSNTLSINGVNVLNLLSGSISRLQVQADGDVAVPLVGSATILKASGNLETTNISADRILLDTNGDRNAIEVDGAAGNEFTVDYGGNVYINGSVGVGTTSPAQKLVVVGDINITGDIINHVPHMQGLATQVHTTPVINTWYNITFNDSVGFVEHITFTENNTVVITEEGDYTIMFGVSVQDSSAAPSSHVAIRIAVNDVELEGSYKEFDPTKQNSQTWLDLSVYAEELNVGDRLNMQYIASDTDVTIESHASYATTPFVAYGFITKEHD